MPPKPDKPRCLLCGVNASFRTSAICKACHEIVRERGQVWCNAGRHVVARTEWTKAGICKACNNRQAKARAAAKRTACAVRCVRCQEGATDGHSALCRACHADLKASGQSWCARGQHVVARAEMSSRGGMCRTCATAVDRERYAERSPAITGACMTCHQPLAGHARCDGCTRLLHGEAAQEPLCRLCARDRANGVPPQGYSWRELEVAARRS